MIISHPKVLLECELRDMKEREGLGRVLESLGGPHRCL